MRFSATVVLVVLVLPACEIPTLSDEAFFVPPPQFATLSVPGDYASIQAAHDAATSGDVILVAPGTYTGQITITKAITLASLYRTTGDPSFIANTILDGERGRFVIEIPSDAEAGATIQGVTIQNADDGITPRAHFTLLDCLVRDTSDGVDYEDGSGGLVQFCTFEENSDDGIDLDYDVAVVIADNVIRNNGDDGIEIRLQSYTGPVLDITIVRNEIHGNGEDGIQLIHYDVLTDRFFEIAYNTIYDNVDAGIGMMDGQTSTEDFRAASIPERIDIFDNTFVNNSHGVTGGDNTVVLNNIFVGHPVTAVKNVDGSSALAFNLFFNNGIDNSGSNVDAGTTLYADPLLTAGLELQAGSPAVDAGTASYVWQGTTVLDRASDEYIGTAPDLGAFELVPAGPPPTSPVLVAPTDGEEDVGLTPALSWTGTGDSYLVQVASDIDFTDIVDAATVTTQEHTVAIGALDHLSKYFWRARASNANGSSPFSEVWSFTTAAASAPPDPPALMSPSDGAIDVPLEVTMDWAGTADAFHVEVATDAGFSDLVFEQTSSASTLTLPPGTLTYLTEYFWHVRGTNSFGPGDYAVPFRFATEAEPPPTPTVHIGGITMELRRAGRRLFARAVISVVDEAGVPVTGATVAVLWSGLVSNTDSGITTDGDVQFDSDRVDRSLTGQFEITVTDVTASGFVHDPSADVVTAGCVDTAGEVCSVEPPPPPDEVAPEAPTGLTATGGPGRVSLDWSANAEPDLASYSVHRSTTSGTEYVSIADGLTASDFVDHDVTAHIPYFYVVRAWDTSGNGSAASDEASATPTDPPPSSVHVGGLTLDLVKQGKNYLGRVTVSVLDQDGTPITGVEVHGSWRLDSEELGTVTGITDGTGSVVLESPKRKAASGDTFTFTVTDLVLAGYTYASGSNVETSVSVVVP